MTLITKPLAPFHFVTPKYPQAINGYADGNYQCKCGKCEQFFMGDKRAVRCISCSGVDKMREQWNQLYGEDFEIPWIKFEDQEPEEDSSIIIKPVKGKSYVKGVVYYNDYMKEQRPDDITHWIDATIYDNLIAEREYFRKIYDWNELSELAGYKRFTNGVFQIGFSKTHTQLISKMDDNFILCLPKVKFTIGLFDSIIS